MEATYRHCPKKKYTCLPFLFASATKCEGEIEKEDMGYIAVQPVTYVGKPYSKGAWRMTNAIRSWSWPGCEGVKATVGELDMKCFSICNHLNGTKAGFSGFVNGWDDG